MTMNTEDTTLTTITDGGFTSAQIDLIRRQIAPDASADELALFLEVCRGTGLNPFMRQIHAVFRNAKDRNGNWTKRMTIQTGIDGYRLLAARTGSLAGIDDVIYDDESGEHPSKATVTVWRLAQGQRVPFTATARWREYVQTDKDGRPQSMWAKMPYLLLGKCAEALALRKAFPAELSGVYTAEEMMQADNSLPEPPRTAQRHDIPPHHVRTTVEASPTTEDTSATSRAQSTQATTVEHALDDFNQRANQHAQLDVCAQLRRNGHDSAAKVARILRAALPAERVVNVSELAAGESDITLREVGLVLRAIGAAGAKGAAQ